MMAVIIADYDKGAPLSFRGFVVMSDKGKELGRFETIGSAIEASDNIADSAVRLDETVRAFRIDRYLHALRPVETSAA